jgi:hypothetical protein
MENFPPHITSVDARVFGQWLIAFNCKVLSFGTEINFHRE